MYIRLFQFLDQNGNLNGSALDTSSSVSSSRSSSSSVVATTTSSLTSSSVSSSRSSSSFGSLFGTNWDALSGTDGGSACGFNGDEATFTGPFPEDVILSTINGCCV